MHPCTHTHACAYPCFCCNASLCPKTVHSRRGQTQKNRTIKIQRFCTWSVCRYQVPAEVAVPAKFPKTWNSFPLEKCSAKSIAADRCAQRSTFAHHTYNTSCQLWPYEIPAKEGQMATIPETRNGRAHRSAPAAAALCLVITGIWFRPIYGHKLAANSCLGDGASCVLGQDVVLYGFQQRLQSGKPSGGNCFLDTIQILMYRHQVFQGCVSKQTAGNASERPETKFQQPRLWIILNSCFTCCCWIFLVTSLTRWCASIPGVILESGCFYFLLDRFYAVNSWKHESPQTFLYYARLNFEASVL